MIPTMEMLYDIVSKAIENHNNIVLGFNNNEYTLKNLTNCKWNSDSKFVLIYYSIPIYEGVNYDKIFCFNIDTLNYIIFDEV